MFDRQKNAGHDGDAGIKKKLRSKAVSKKQEGADGRNHRLYIQDNVDHGRVAVLQSEGEEDRAHGRAGEPGEDQVTPAALVDFADLAELRKKDRQKHEQDEDV